LGIWFDVLRYAGAVYLAWLAYKLFRSKGDLAVAIDRARPMGSFFLQGFIVIISNPKMLVLFGAMIPPFIAPGAEPMQQIVLLGMTFMAIACVGDTLYALMAGKAGAWLSRSRIRTLEIVSGCFLLGGGIWMALRGR
jgi:threonine/homoserine/homoserine lactone efflux protein